MLSRIVTLGVVLAMSGPAAAQKSGPDTDPDVKRQVRMFELHIRNVIELAGERLAQKAKQIEPGVVLQFSSDPVISGVVVPEVGPHFDVQVPPILPSADWIYRYTQQTKARSQGDARPGVGTQVATNPAAPQTSDKPTTSAQSMPAADPMSVSPEVNAPFDPTRAYSNFVRDALIDAMLDFSGAFAFGPGEKLTVVAKETIGFVTNPLQRSDLRQLILTIKGEDLIAFRQGKITRDETKQRIVDTRF